jgi:uncharacterized protein YecT (DUF1311 family)
MLAQVLVVALKYAATANLTAPCAEAMTQDAIYQCIAHELHGAESELQSRYGAYRAALSDKGKELLAAAQHAWESYRDANCRAAADVFGKGSMAPVELVGCKLKLTRERIAELNRVYGEPALPGNGR